MTVDDENAVSPELAPAAELVDDLTEVVTTRGATTPAERVLAIQRALIIEALQSGSDLLGEAAGTTKVIAVFKEALSHPKTRAAAALALENRSTDLEAATRLFDTMLAKINLLNRLGAAVTPKAITIDNVGQESVDPTILLQFQKVAQMGSKSFKAMLVAITGSQATDAITAPARSGVNSLPIENAQKLIQIDQAGHPTDTSNPGLTLTVRDSNNPEADGALLVAALQDRNQPEQRDWIPTPELVKALEEIIDGLLRIETKGTALAASLQTAGDVAEYTEGELSRVARLTAGDPEAAAEKDKIRTVRTLILTWLANVIAAPGIRIERMSKPRVDALQAFAEEIKRLGT